MQSKRCFGCRETKPLEEFYAHKQMADGHLNKCKDCVKRDVQRRYRDNCDKIREYARTHSHKQHVRVKRLWRMMLARCYDKLSPSYRNYGGRGISVCRTWRDSFNDFRDWALENGYSPDRQLDRVENDGNYEPKNCRFVTPSQNCNNQRRNVRIRYLGETKTVAEWSRDSRIGLSAATIYSRIARGWSHRDALSVPVRQSAW